MYTTARVARPTAIVPIAPVTLRSTTMATVNGTTTNNTNSGRPTCSGRSNRPRPSTRLTPTNERECGGDPAGDEQRRPAGAELALEPQLGADPGHEQNNEDGEGPGPHVGRRPVVVDELRDTPPDEPALDRLAILARRHGCRRLLPGRALTGEVD